MRKIFFYLILFSVQVFAAQNVHELNDEVLRPVKKTTHLIFYQTKVTFHVESETYTRSFCEFIKCIPPKTTYLVGKFILDEEKHKKEDYFYTLCSLKKDEKLGNLIFSNLPLGKHKLYVGYIHRYELTKDEVPFLKWQNAEVVDIEIDDPNMQWRYKWEQNPQDEKERKNKISEETVEIELQHKRKDFALWR